MSKCDICNIEKVYRQCFYCSDSLVDLFNKGNITKFILKRKIGLKNCKQY